MKSGMKIIAIVMLCLMLSSCVDSPSETVKIAVMGDPENFYPGYQDGIKRAVEDLNAKYAKTGYTVECVFYDDNDNYDEGAVIVDSISNDDSTIAVLASMNMEINQNAAYAFEKAKKVFVVPFALYDSVFQNNYKHIFSMCYSGEFIGKILHDAIRTKQPGRWAVCVGDGEFEKYEASSLMSYTNDNLVEIVDCVSIVDLRTRFNEVYERWETLGVDGAIILQKGKQSFDLLKKIKTRNPNMLIAGDTSFDNSAMIKSDKELRKMVNGLIMVDEFEIFDSTEESMKKTEKIFDDYYKKTGDYLDTWYFQGYNAVCMVADTAIKNNTLSAKTISEKLYENGYQGILQKFKFNTNGVIKGAQGAFSIYDAKGYPTQHEIEK